MSEFLIEIYSEEIPAKMQAKAAANFKQIFSEFFEKQNIGQNIGQNIKFDAEQLKSFISPRRLILLASNLQEFQIIPAVRKNGPKIDADQKAIDGFLKSVGVASVNELSKNETNYYFDQKENKISTADILQKNLPTLLQKMSNSWPKTMKWKSGQTQFWVRPIRNILCIFNGKTISFEFAGIGSNCLSRGSFLDNDNFEVSNFNQYKNYLSDTFIIFDGEERKKNILNKIKEICTEINCKPIEELDDNNPLLNEVVGLVEYPEVLLGKIDDEFMHLPAEILILTIKLNQKYFCLKNEKGDLMPYFIFVSNVRANEKAKEKIIADNGKVVKARLNDARFFIEEDLRTPLLMRLESLKNIIFHEKLGSVYDKSKRLETLCEFISIWVPYADLSLADDMAKLAKCDLNTKAVVEFTELQGIIGGHYARIQGYKPEIYEAISEHYLPLGPNSKLPKTSLGALLSIADKIDTICGLFLINEKPTSSKDPYALRRAALGIIRILIDHKISLPLKIVIDKALNIYPSKTIKQIYSDKAGGEINKIKQKLTLEIIDFFAERLKAFLKDNWNIKADVINEVFAADLPLIKNDKKCNLMPLANKAKFINDFISNPANLEVISLYRRAANIVTIEEKKDQTKYDEKPSNGLLENKYEKLLYTKIKNLSPKIKKLTKNNKYDEAFILLNDLQHPINYFFDHVVVNVEEKNIRINRLLILANIRDLFDEIFNFSKIEVEKL
jgi:glycyl-tRNA synthetase beta chain